MSAAIATEQACASNDAWKAERHARQEKVNAWFDQELAERGSLREEGDRSRCRVRAHLRRFCLRFGAGGKPIYFTDNGARAMAFVDGQPWAGERSFGVAVAEFVKTGFLRVVHGRFGHEGKGSPSRRLYLAGELAAQEEREKSEREQRVRLLFSRLRARDERRDRCRLRGRARRRTIAELARLGVPPEELRPLETEIRPTPAPSPKVSPPKLSSPPTVKLKAPPLTWALTAPPSEEQLALSREARLKARSELAHLFDPPKPVELAAPAIPRPVDAAQLRLITDSRDRQLALLEAKLQEWSREEARRRAEPGERAPPERAPPDGDGS